MHDRRARHMAGGYQEGGTIDTLERADAEGITAKAVKRARNWRG
ncbi:hypothetical protein [Actinoplanes sp. NPDC049599]